MDKNTELRKVPLGTICSLIQIVEQNKGWKELMSQIPKHLDCPEFEPKYNSEHISLIEAAGFNQKRPCTQILFDEWGTSGRKRPTLSHLLDILLKAKIYQAADKLATEILNEPLPKRPITGPEAIVDTSVTELLAELKEKDIDRQLENIAYPTSTPQNSDAFDKNLNYRKCNLPTENSNSKNRSTAKMETNMEKSDMIEFTSARLPPMPSDDEIIPAFSILLQSTDSHLRNIKQDPIINEATPNTELSSNNTNETDRRRDDLLPDFDALNYDVNRSLEEENNQYQQSIPNITALQNNSSNKQLCTTIPHYDYADIKKCSNNFSKQCNIAKGIGGKIGEGGFGEVYVAFGLTDRPVAVKHLRNRNNIDVNLVYKQFRTEVETLSKYSHINIVSILGYSIDSACCIVYEYITGGSLRQNLDEETLTMKQRLKILTGTARGLEYLHCGMETPLIHRDVKSTNILLADKCVPKLCDFGIAKFLKDENSGLTTAIIGTPAYMAPEALKGYTSEKSDVFSFGVVTIEVLTALPANDSTRNGIDILQRSLNVCKNNDITPLIDKNIANEKDGANELYAISLLCVNLEKSMRPNIGEVCEHLENIRLEEFI